MAEYIEREALRSKAVYMHGFGNNKYVPLSAIENALAADVAPVVHGKWVYPLGMAWNYVCSECGKSIGVIKHNYCPNCGAHMKDGDS